MISVRYNYALAVIFITALAITMASGGHAVESIAELLWARAIDTIIGCTIGIGVLLVTAPRALAVPIPQELAAALDVEPQEVVPGQSEPADRRLRFYTTVGPVPIVLVQPDR